MDVEFKPGRRGALEVTLGGQVIHSKLATGEWPDTEELLGEIARRVKT